MLWSIFRVISMECKEQNLKSYNQMKSQIRNKGNKKTFTAAGRSFGAWPSFEGLDMLVDPSVPENTLVRFSDLGVAVKLAA